MRNRVTAARLGGLVAISTVGLAVGAVVGPARAAQSSGRWAAPYTAGDHSTWNSCSSGQAVPACATSSSADPKTGAMDVSAAADSGLGGNVPGTVESGAIAGITQTVGLGDATAATFVFHVRVSGLETAYSGQGRAYVTLFATAGCDRCPQANEQYAFPYSPGDQTVAITLVRGTTGGQAAHLRLASSAYATVQCDDFCLQPSGAARASAHAQLTGIEVTRWGLGRPSAPGIDQPGPGATVTPSTFRTQCDTQCQPFTGEQMAGTAEPGMPVSVSDEGGRLAQTQADATGHWTIDVALPRGPHTLTASADGPQGTTTSTPRTFTVT